MILMRSEPPRLIFFGTSDFAVPILERIAPWVVLVVSQPDRPTGRGLKVQMSPVKRAALDLGLPVETPTKARAPEFVSLLRDLQADALIVAAYGQILSQATLDTARMGGINLHGSILPRYRGAAPIQRAIMNGDSSTGVTLMQMDKGMDTGDMIEVVATPIDPDETYGELQDALAAMAADLLERQMGALMEGSYGRAEQDHEEATIAPKIDPAERVLNPFNDARQEYNRFRGLTPQPGVYLNTIAGRLKVTKARWSAESGDPGTWIGPQHVAFLGGALELKEVQPEGKQRMSGRDFANGLRIKVGDRLIP